MSGNTLLTALGGPLSLSDMQNVIEVSNPEF